MRLISLRRAAVNEGVVEVAKGEIVEIVNKSASKVAELAFRQGWPRPAVQFAKEPNDPATVKIKAGGNKVFRTPQTITITIVGDSQFRLEVPKEVAKILFIEPITDLRSPDKVAETLEDIRGTMRRHTAHLGEGFEPPPDDLGDEEDWGDLLDQNQDGYCLVQDAASELNRDKTFYEGRSLVYIIQGTNPDELQEFVDSIEMETGHEIGWYRVSELRHYFDTHHLASVEVATLDNLRRRLLEPNTAIGEGFEPPPDDLGDDDHWDDLIDSTHPDEYCIVQDITPINPPISAEKGVNPVSNVYIIYGTNRDQLEEFIASIPRPARDDLGYYRVGQVLDWFSYSELADVEVTTLDDLKERLLKTNPV